MPGRSSLSPVTESPPCSGQLEQWPQARSCGGPAHGLDDHRDRHEREIERRFARKLASSIVDFVEDEGATRHIVAADPRLLGLLREPLEAKLPDGLERRELAEDLSWHAVPHIEGVLIRRDVLPRKTVSATAYRPRAQPPSAERTRK